LALGIMPWGTTVTPDQAAALFDAYSAAGGNVLDTAHLYACWDKTPAGANGLGASERALGEFLRKRPGARRLLVIISKGGHPAFEPDYKRPDRYLAPEVVRRDLDETLDRLGLPMLDLYFLHRDDRRVPVGEIIDLLNELVSEGKIRYFGGSNWSAARMEEASQYAAGKGVMGFVASQPEFSLAVPATGTAEGAAEPSDDLATRFLTAADRAWHERTGFPAFCYSPTARGYFASAGRKAADAFNRPESRARLARVQGLASRKGMSPNQVAVAWLRGQKFPAIPILGTSKVDHLQDALRAADLRLSAEEVKWLAGW
jgi:aryl-alcohol dehydrogenase-like predicted oxidoreductase